MAGLAAGASLPLAAGLGRVLAALAGLLPAEPAAAPDVDEIAALRRREPGAWDALFEREMPAIYRYAYGSVGNAQEAEDIAGATFAEAWESAGRLEDYGLPARAWLFGIARNIIGGHRRRLFRKPPPLSLEPFDAPDERARMTPELLDLARAIAGLDRAHAEVVVLRFIHGLSLQEAAAVLGTSVDGVKGRQARALVRLREQLA